MRSRPRLRGRNRFAVVVAPHPDDDVIGCGGILARAVAHGWSVHAVYVTDGSASHVRSRSFPPLALARLREGEARNALRALGITRAPTFLRAPDGGLATLPERRSLQLADALARTLEAARPDVLFAPWCRDPHADHVATAALVARALSRLTTVPRVYAYAVWLDSLGTAPDRPVEGEVTTLEVSLSAAEREKKRTAILQHRSQTTHLIDDDPDGFRIGPELLAAWTGPSERFYVEPGGSARGGL